MCFDLFYFVAIIFVFCFVFFFLFLQFLQAGTQELHFVECIVNLTTLDAKVTLKGQSDAITKISRLFQSTISGIVA